MPEKEQLPSEADISNVMRALGRRKTPAKKAATEKNIAAAQQARRRNILEVPCTCSGGDSLDPDAHTYTCPRGNILKQRARYAQKKAEGLARKQAA